MTAPTSRVVTVVLDQPRGALPTFTLDTPWWQEVESVVDAVRDEFGLDIVVLRVLEGETPFVSPVTYLAEVTAGDPAALLEPWTKPIADDPLRAAYARPGGPQADLDWAARHVAFTGQPVQVRTWNLSSIWRIPTTTGSCGSSTCHRSSRTSRRCCALSTVAAPVPHLIAGEPGRMLLADVPGRDCYDATRPELEAMVDTLVDLQGAWAGRVDDVLALGAPDWRSSAFIHLAQDVVERDAGAELRTVLDPFVERLPQAFADLDSCGLPNTFVHGDFHPGNVRWTNDGPVVLDWGDAGVGHPLLDLPAFLDRAGPHTAELEARWLDRWAVAYPGSDPRRAADVIAPIAALRRAIVYRGFLDGIEETERVYHRSDVPEQLQTAVALIS